MSTTAQAQLSWGIALDDLFLDELRSLKKKLSRESCFNLNDQVLFILFLCKTFVVVVTASILVQYSAVPIGLDKQKFSA